MNNNMPMAPLQGFEPCLAVLETVVLPLNTREINLVRVERIELSTKRWQRLILPLNYTRIEIIFF